MFLIIHFSRRPACKNVKLFLVVTCDRVYLLKIESEVNVELKTLKKGQK